MNIPHKLVHKSYGWEIQVAEEYREYAQKQIELFEKENREKHEPAPYLFQVNINFILLISFFLYSFQLYVQATDNDIHWIEYGNSSASDILRGEWWRSVTALTLHADMIHVISNIILLSITAYSLCSEIGIGMGWFLILLSGASGNLLNALAHLSEHKSIGSSTAVFGAIGILAGLQFPEKFKLSRFKGWIPLAGAIGLLAFFGTGENTDLASHFFGFLSGILIGVIAFFLKSQYNNNNLKSGKALTQIIPAVLSITLILYCWFKALKII